MEKEKTIKNGIKAKNADEFYDFRMLDLEKYTSVEIHELMLGYNDDIYIGRKTISSASSQQLYR